MMNDEIAISSKVFKEIEPFCCAAEMGTTLYTDYISIQNTLKILKRENF